MAGLRIALVSEQASPFAAGEQNAHVAGLARALAARGHMIRVYTRLDPPDQPAKVPAGARVTVEHVDRDEFAERLEKSWDGDFVPDVVHAHYWTSGEAALTAMSQRRLPLVVTYHAFGSTEQEQALGHEADAVIALCGEEMTELLRCGVPRQRIVRIPSGVDTGLFCPAGEVAEWPDSRPVILTVGQLAERKGFADLVRALPHVPRARLVIAGGPLPDGEPLLRLADKAGVLNRVTLLGAVPHDELPPLYRGAGVVACTPWYEPFGTVPLEAMACGTPVVAYAVGGLRESVVDGVTGVLVPPRDVRSLALALRRLISDQVTRVSYASAALDRARSRYDWSRQAADIERLYEDLVTNGLELAS